MPKTPHCVSQDPVSEYHHDHNHFNHFNHSVRTRSLTQVYHFSMPPGRLPFDLFVCFTEKLLLITNSFILFSGGLNNKQITSNLIVEMTLSNLWKPLIKCILHWGQGGWPTLHNEKRAYFLNMWTSQGMKTQYQGLQEIVQNSDTSELSMGWFFPG